MGEKSHLYMIRYYCPIKIIYEKKIEKNKTFALKMIEEGAKNGRDINKSF